MAIRKPDIQETGYYFITFTCHKWLQLFKITNGYDLIYKWFDYLHGFDHKIIGYVIMPNHLHLMLAYKHTDKTLNKIIGNGKRFLAYGIVKKLKEQKANNILEILQQGVNVSDSKRNKLHAVFEDSFEVKKCDGNKFLQQKLQYIHNNPCSKKWMLANDIISYPHSSALYYEAGKQGLYPVVSWMELEADGWWTSPLIP